MEAMTAIEIERGRSQEFRRSACRRAAQEIHLEEAVLGVQKTRCISQIAAVNAADRGHTDGIAINRDGGR